MADATTKNTQTNIKNPKTMKTKDLIKMLVASFLIAYLIHSFVLWDLNPINWQSIGRFLFLLETSLVFILISLANHLKEINN